MIETTTALISAEDLIMATTMIIPRHNQNMELVTFVREVYSYLVPLMVTVLLIAVIGNCLIVLSAPFTGRHVSPYHRLCISLAASDAWAGSLLIIGLIVNSYMPVVLRIKKKTECMSTVLEIFRISGMLTSNLHILALAFNQFIGIVHPIKYKTAITTKRLRGLILLLWIVPIVFVGSWFVLIPNDGFRNANCKAVFYNSFPFRMSVFTAFVIPLLITFILYACIVRELLLAKAKSANDIRRSMRDSSRRKINSRVKLTYTTLIILLTFVLSWGACVLYFLLVCNDGCVYIYMKTLSFKTGLFLNSSVNFLVALKLLFNPLIYALRLDHIRSSIFNFTHIVFFSHIKRKAFGESTAKFEQHAVKSLALSRTASCQSAPISLKTRSLVVTRRQYDETPRVMTDLINLIDNELALNSDMITRVESPGLLTVNDLSFGSSTE